jgi:F-type H+-transporting ATPase subunit delta
VSVATTYAEALYEAAVDKDQVPQVAGELAEVREAVAATPDLARLLDDPEIDTRVKKDVVSRLLEGANPLVANFVQVLIDRGRGGELEEIGAAFDQRVAAAEGRLRIVVRTAVPMPDDLRSGLLSRLESRTGRPVDLDAVVDPEIIGGLVIESEGSVVDASVRQRLSELRRSLAAAPVTAAVAAE